MVNEHYVVSFEDEEHKRYVELLQEFGFNLSLSGGLKVGLQFYHPIKHHIVRLDREEDPSTGEIYEPHLFIRARQSNSSGRVIIPQMADYDTPMYPDHYSVIEWDWLQADDPSCIEFLKRELHIWFKVRPHSLNTMQDSMNAMKSHEA
jgi:hypothetical protein